MSLAEENYEMNCPKNFRLNKNPEVAILTFFISLPITFSPEGGLLLPVSFGSLEHLVKMRAPLGLIYNEFDAQQ